MFESAFVQDVECRLRRDDLTAVYGFQGAKCLMLPLNELIAAEVPSEISDRDSARCRRLIASLTRSV